MGDGLMHTSGGEVLAFLGIGLLVVFLILADYGILITLCLFGLIELLYSIKLTFDLIKAKKKTIAIVGMVIIAIAFIYGLIKPLVLMGRRFYIWFSPFACVAIPALIYTYVAQVQVTGETVGEITWQRLTHLLIAAGIGFALAFGIGFSDKDQLDKYFNSNYKVEDVRQEETSSVDTINNCLKNLYEAEKQSYPEKSEEDLNKTIRSDIKSEKYLNNRLKDYYYTVTNIEEESNEIWIFSIKDKQTGQTHKYKVNMNQLQITEEVVE